jgi:hypothetical protein
LTRTGQRPLPAPDLQLALGIRNPDPPFEDPELGPGLRDPQHELRAFDIRRHYGCLDRQGLRYSAQDMHHASMSFNRKDFSGSGTGNMRVVPSSRRGLGLVGELPGGATECSDAHAVSGADEARGLRPRRARALDHCQDGSPSPTAPSMRTVPVPLQHSVY